MPRVTIQEASRILNVSQDVIRKDVRNGKLTASKEGGPGGSRWMVDIPDNVDDYADDFKENIHALARTLTPWWYDNPSATGVRALPGKSGNRRSRTIFPVRRQGQRHLARHRS